MTGKLANPCVQGQLPEGEKNKAHLSNLHVCVSPVTPTGGYCFSRVVNGVETSLSLATGHGAVVTLLRDDTWARITAKKPQELRLWSVVSAGGVPLSMHGSAHIEQQLEGNIFMTDIVVYSKPPNLGRHPWPGILSEATG